MKNIPSKPQITFVPTEELKPNKNNARKHSPKQIQQTANSIKEFGFMNPVLIDAENRIMAGHCRVEAAKKLGMKEVPVIRTTHLSENQIRAYIIADNKIAQNATWDKELLTVEIKHLTTVVDLDVEVTGFEMAEIDQMIEIDPPKNEPDDELPELEEDKPAITTPGTIWELGKHRLMCGDATHAFMFKELMDEECADMIFADPPYNVPIDGHVCGNGKIKHKEFAMASGEMSDEDFQKFLHKTCKNMVEFSKDGSIHFICMDWRHILDLLWIGKGLYTDLKNICVWNKDNGGMGTLYRSKHEFVAVFKHGLKTHVNNIELGKHGRYRTNVWDYAGVNSFGKQKADLEMHPTVKPIAMVMDAIKDCSKRGDIILDPFAGSGTTLIACEKTGRAARCMEFDGHYCDLIVRRWQKLTGKEAYNSNTFKSFNELSEEI